LVEDPNNERRQDGENDIVHGQRPRLVGDLSGKVVEERVLIFGGVIVRASFSLK
jgi:hypothetical protein